jgi:hypothetical protein
MFRVVGLSFDNKGKKPASYLDICHKLLCQKSHKLVL